MKTKLIIAALAGVFAFATAQAATQMSTADYKSKKDSLGTTYKAAKERCKPLSGNAKDICQAEAKGEHDVAEAELKAERDGTPKAQADARAARAEATYKVAKEKCDDLKGNDKDVCNKEAKAAHTKAKADAKVTKEVKKVASGETSMQKAPEKIADAKREAKDDKRDAEYKVAKEKCDALSGQTKDNCIAQAKLKFK
jgi:hypothetical protein